MLLDEKTLAALQKFGLTYYGARIYETLVLLGSSDATRLSSESDVPRTKVYDILRRLETEGWITSKHTRPITYTARYPRDVLEERKAAFNAAVDETSNELSMLYDNQVDKENPRVWLLRGSGNVTAKLLDMISRSKKSVLLMGALYFADEIGQLKKELANAKKRGVTVRLLTQKSIRLKDGDLDILGQLSPVVSEVKIYGPPYSKSAVVDDREILMVFSRIDGEMPDEDSIIAIWIPNTSVASYWASVFNAVWCK
jgi:HTH-type transcriptional regulator, sugar sensing transcriptional regulator